MTTSDGAVRQRGDVPTDGRVVPAVIDDQSSDHRMTLTQFKTHFFDGQTRAIPGINRVRQRFFKARTSCGGHVIGANPVATRWMGANTFQLMRSLRAKLGVAVARVRVVIAVVMVFVVVINSSHRSVVIPDRLERKRIVLVMKIFGAGGHGCTITVFSSIPFGGNFAPQELFGQVYIAALFYRSPSLERGG